MTEIHNQTVQARILAWTWHNLLFLCLLAAVLFSNIYLDRYVVLTGSMEPALQTGAIVFVDPHQTPKQYEVGAYNNNGSTVIHRVDSITPEGYIFKGDANLDRDPKAVPPEDLSGKVIWKINFVSPLVRRLFHL